MSDARFKCPTCKSEDLRVEVKAVAVLIQEPDGNLQTQIESDHDWDGTSTMMCGECNKVGSAEDFDGEKVIEHERI